VLLALLFIFRNDLVHADGTPDAMGADTREHLLPRQRALQESDLHFSTVGELHTGFQEHHVIFHHAFTDHDLLASSSQIRWKLAYNLEQISARHLLGVLSCGKPPLSGDQVTLLFCFIYRKRVFFWAAGRELPEVI
jgi:hypothetical protein